MDAASFLNTKRKKIFNDCMSSLQSCAELIEKHSGAGKLDQMKSIKTIAKEYYDIETNFDKATQVINQTTEYFNTEENDCTEDVDKVYEKCSEDIIHELVPFKEHWIWKAINKGISDVKMEQQQNEDNADNSLLCSQSFQLPIDPLSKTVIQNPYKNRACGHVYDYDSIMYYINSRKPKTVSCPYFGCMNSNVVIDDLVKDNELRQIISRTIDD